MNKTKLLRLTGRSQTAVYNAPMQKNLALELWEKHRQELALENLLVIADENDIFRPSAAPAGSAVVFLPKSKALIDMTLALVSGMVLENRKIVLAGEKSAGIESAKKAFEKNIGPVEQKIVGNHSALYVGKNKKLGADKKIEDFLSYSPISYKDAQIEIANLPGVFSAGELDEGTRLLLDHIPYDKKKMLDVGCGSGVIGTIYKKKNQASEVLMSDRSKLAVMAARKTLEANKLSAKVMESDVFENIKGKFDLIVSNPPFHRGVDTDYSFIENFARGAKQHLKRDGKAYVVANSFLPYGKVLKKFFEKTDILADDGKFKIYRSSQPRKTVPTRGKTGL